MSLPRLYTGNKIDPQNPYLPSPPLVEAVNLAIALGRPLLIKGEPGSGKTKLAEAVAFELNLPYEEWYVKSTSRARDGLYIYDAVGRLRDAQLAANPRIDLKEVQKPISEYITYGALGKAIRNTTQTVVLIDEIDKADIDFPNDLLRELDEMAFTVDELPGQPRNPSNNSEGASKRPIVFITSNDEKELPEAFLRRCVFYYIEFPDRDRLLQILNEHYKESNLSTDTQSEIIERFLKLREQMIRDMPRSGKKVTTSELLDWFNVLSYFDDTELQSLLKARNKLPYPSVLLKTWDSHQKYLMSEPIE